MKKKIILPVSIGLAILLVVILFLWHKQQNNVIYNTSYVNGNTAGNLYNGGLFCESDGTVFFANPDDSYRLYSMDADGSNLKKLCNDSVMYINADSNYLYYVRNNSANSSSDFVFSLFSYNNNSLCRISRNGGDVTILDSDPCIYASLIGNQIYYLHYDSETATTLYKIGIDGKNRMKLSDTYVFTCSTSGQYFYYNDMRIDGSIYRYDTATDQTSKIYSCNSYKPIVVSSNNAYYLNVNENNALVHTDLKTQTPTTLTTDSIDAYNVYGSYIYYQKYDPDGHSALCMIKNDGSEATELLEGDFNSIHVTSYYIYFTDYHTGSVFYTPTANPGELSAFHPGILE